MRIAVVGYGGVGKAFVKLVQNKEKHLHQIGIDARINYVIGRNGGYYDPEGINLQDFLACQSEPMEVTFEMMLANGDIDVLVELTPTNKETGEPGITHIERALSQGIHVVTGNKGPIMLAYNRLMHLAKENGVQLGIGCTTGGALPAINGGMIDLAGAEILSIEGVLNGTTNFIINEMESSGSDYFSALEKAQELGIAETDPSLDVEGWDTAGKLVILTNALMKADRKLVDVSVTGITGLTPEQVAKSLDEGEKYKLVGKTEMKNGELIMTVGPERLKSFHPLYHVDGKNKGVRYTSDVLGDLTIIGGASGVTPAAASVLRDLINISQGYKYCK